MKNIVITGAGGVLCSAFARHLAAQGHTVILLDINEEAVCAVAAQINAAGGKAYPFRADVLDKVGLLRLHEQILCDVGKCDVLINGAGGNNKRCTTDRETWEAGDEARDDLQTFFRLDPDGFRFVFDLNLLGTLLPTQVFAPDMLGRKGCCVLNISSMNAFRPLTKIPAYSAAKAGVSNLTQWLAVHFAPQGIRVNALAPGFFVTHQNRALLFDEQGNPTPRTEKILRATPMGRFGEADELLGGLDFLLDENAAGFITGVVLPIDGGFSAYSGV